MKYSQHCKFNTFTFFFFNESRTHCRYSEITVVSPLSLSYFKCWLFSESILISLSLSLYIYTGCFITWVFFIPIMIIMKIECTIPGKASLLEFALSIKFIVSHKRRQIGHVFIWFSFRYFYNHLPKWVPQVTKHPVYFFLWSNLPSPWHAVTSISRRRISRNCGSTRSDYSSGASPVNFDLHAV